MIEVEFLAQPDCPHVEATRLLLSACLGEVGLPAEVRVRVGPFPSPSIVVNGRDVMGNPAETGPCCRLDLPTRERILAALVAARG